MFYIKAILFLLIGSMGSYLLLDVIETRNAVISANNPYSQEEIDFTAYGPEGKEKALIYEKKMDKYREKMNAERKIVQEKLDAQKKIENADAKLKNKIIIKGKISKNSFYNLRVYYIAQKKSFFCSSTSLFSGTSQKSKLFEYLPEIKNEHHKIIIPTDEISWFNVCDYQLDTIYMDSELIFEKKGDTLKFMGNIYPQSQYPKFTKLRKVWKNQYTVDVYENSHLQIQKEQNNRNKTVIHDTRDIDSVVSKQLHKELKLLAEAFDAYNQVHRKKLTAEEGKRILRNEMNLSNCMSKEELDNYQKEIKETITYRNLDPIDPWGNPYKYRDDYAFIYSDGAENFDYKRSLSHKLKPFKTRREEAIRQMATLAQLFSNYIVKMGYAPTNDEAQKLLRHEENLAMSDFYGQHELKRYEKIPKRAGNPLDPWGNAYQYREENLEKVIDAVLYSVGEDGVKSSDDIFFYDIYSSTRAPSQIKRNYPRGNSSR